MRKFDSARVRLALIAILVASVSVSAAPPERTRITASSTSISAQNTDGVYAQVSMSEQMEVTNGVATTSKHLQLFGDFGACGYMSHWDPNGNVTLSVSGRNSRSGQGTYEGVHPYTTQAITVTISGSSTTSYTSRIRGVLEDATSKQQIAIVQDESPMTSPQVDVALDGTSCFSGPFESGSITTAEQRVTVTQ